MKVRWRVVAAARASKKYHTASAQALREYTLKWGDRGRWLRKNRWLGIIQHERVHSHKYIHRVYTHNIYIASPHPAPMKLFICIYYVLFQHVHMAKCGAVHLVSASARAGHVLNNNRLGVFLSAYPYLIFYWWVGESLTQFWRENHCDAPFVACQIASFHFIYKYKCAVNSE